MSKGSQPLHTIYDPVTNATLVVNADGSINVTASGFAVSENLAEVGGTAVDVGAGNSSPGTLRTVLATNQPALAITAAALPLPAGAATSALQPTAAAQGSTTLGQTGTLAEAAVVSGDQAYTAGQTSPLTLTPSGRLRVGLSSAGGVVPGTAGTASDLIGGIYQSAPAAATDGQQRALQQTAAGNLKVDGSSVVQPVDGGTASGVAIANPPVTVGGRAATTNPAVVADGQVANVMLSKHGKVVTIDGAPRDLKGSQKTSISNSTAEATIITAGAAGVFNDLYGLIFANTGASTTKVDIRDATGGTIITTFEVPTLETRGIMLPAGSALSQTTAANNWTAQCTTATTALEVTALYIKTT